MSTLADRKESRSMFQAVGRWLRTSPDPGRQELGHLSENELEHIATDLGISSTELYKLARSDSSGAELLRPRMAALNLDCNEVAQLMPETLRDLQRLCTFCNKRAVRARSWRQRP